MNTNKNKKLFLLPYRFQAIGWIVAGIGLLSFVISLFLQFEPLRLLRWGVGGFLVLYIGLFMVGFSREKREDEFTLYLRTSSALTAMLVVFAVKITLSLVIGILMAKGLIGKEDHELVKDSVEMLTGFGMVFILYLVMYKVRLFRYNKESGNEK